MYKTSTIQWFYIQTSSKHRVMIPHGLSCPLPNPAIAAEFFTSSSKSCYCSGILYKLFQILLLQQNSLQVGNACAKYLADAVVDQQVCMGIIRCAALVNQDQLVAVIVIDEACGRINIE